MNKDRFHLETYREHEIWYNADTDKFTVELLIEENWKEKSRKSLKDCRKAIDEHIKANFEFKPIRILYKKWYGDASERTIKQVRHDGGLVLSDNKGKAQIEISESLDQLKGKSNSFYNYSAEYIDYLDRKKELTERHKQELQELNKKEPQLTPLDLSFVKQIANL